MFGECSLALLLVQGLVRVTGPMYGLRDETSNAQPSVWPSPMGSSRGSMENPKRMGIQRSKDDLKGIYREYRGNRKREGNLEEIQKEFKGNLEGIQREY